MSVVDLSEWGINAIDDGAALFERTVRKAVGEALGYILDKNGGSEGKTVKPWFTLEVLFDGGTRKGLAPFTIRLNGCTDWDLEDPPPTLWEGDVLLLLRELVEDECRRDSLVALADDIGREGDDEEKIAPKFRAMSSALRELADYIDREVDMREQGVRDGSV